MSASRITFHDGQDDQGAALERIARTVRAQLAGLPALSGHGADAPRRPLFTGIGASYAALAVPVDTLRRAGLPAQRVLASDIEEGLTGFDTDLLIGVSQSGRSSETIAAFRAAAGTRTLAVLNVAPSPLGELADLTVGLGNESDSYASTIGFTGTVLALDLIAGRLSGRTEDPWADVAELTRTVRARASTAVERLRVRAAGCVAADCVASGASRTSAEEAALLLREVPRMPAAASATRNYLHGEMESAGNTLHLVFGDGREIDLAHSLAGAGHTTLLVTTRTVPPEGDLHVVRLPVTAPAPRVVLETVVVQELVQALSLERGVPIESFVFANDDTKEGGVDPGDFAVASPVLGAGSA
ncbi:SIS domain-containing protein [Streptomyces sp. NPDC090025]|uniref:SIS domain-containing protein n=1 Tax=Streptomyces sp. NPDC090025 TaxID=3365922 RepID=UPI0038348F6D